MVNTFELVPLFPFCNILEATFPPAPKPVTMDDNGKPDDKWYNNAPPCSDKGSWPHNFYAFGS